MSQSYSEEASVQSASASYSGSTVKQRSSGKPAAKAPMTTLSTMVQGEIAIDDQLGWRVLGFIQSIDYTGRGSVELRELSNVVRLLTSDVTSSEWSRDSDDDSSDDVDDMPGLRDVSESVVDNLLEIAADIAFTEEGSEVPRVHHNALRTAITESDNEEELSDLLEELDSILAAKLEYTYTWGYIPLLVVILIAGFVSGMMLSSSFQESTITGPRILKSGSFIGPGILLLPYFWFFVPLGRKMYRSLFPGWRDHTLLAFLSVGWLYMINFALMYWSDGKTLFSNDSSIAATTTASYMSWGGVILIVAAPSGVRFKGSGFAAKWRELRLLSLVPVDLPALHGSRTIRTAADVVRLIRDRTASNSREKTRWADRIIFSIMLFVFASGWVTLPLWLRFFAWEDNPNILPGDWVIYALNGIGNGVTCYVVIDNVVFVATATYNRVAGDLKSLTAMLTSATATAAKLPHMPPFAGNNDYAYQRLRKYLTYHDEALPLARATFTVSLAAIVCIVEILVSLSMYLGDSYDNFAMHGFFAIALFAVVLTVCVAALLVNEALGAFTRALELEVFHQQSRGNDSLTFGSPALAGINSLLNYLKANVTAVKIVGVPITRNTLIALRVAFTFIAMTLYQTVREVLVKVAEDDRGEELYGKK